MAKKASREEWADRVRAWKRSGLSRAKFATGKPFSERSLSWWAWKLKSEGVEFDEKRASASKPERAVVDVLELVEVEQQRTASPLLLRFGTAEVMVEAGFDHELLGELLDVLEARR